jgi:hypothetical protein
MKYDVFISYKSEDKNMAIELYDFLQNNELSAFYAKKTINDAEFKKIIDEALDNSQSLIVIASKVEYLTSEYVRYEWDTFSNNILITKRKGSQVLTILPDEININDIPFNLRNRHIFNLSEYKNELMPFLKKEKEEENVEINDSKKPRQKWWKKILLKLLNLKDRLLGICSVGIIIVLIFSLFFFAGFGYTHYSETRYDKLYNLAYDNIELQENEEYLYALLETEDAYYNLKDSKIWFTPKTEKTVNIYKIKRDETVKSIALLSVGSLFTTLFEAKIKGNNKQTVWLYVGGTVAIILGYGVGHQVSLKYYPALESDNMKVFLSEKENWQLIVDKKNAINIKQ